MVEPSHNVIPRLQQLPGSQDPYLSKRKEYRTNLRAKAQLDVLRADGQSILVSAFDVSQSGIGFLARREFGVDERVGIRFAFDADDYEDFVVRRGTPTVGGFRIGVSAIEES